jgi:protein SCO1/2
MKRLLKLAVLLLLAVPSAWAQQYPVTGMVLTVDRSRNTFTASIREIPGFMAAMTMPFEVRQPTDLDGLAPGAAVEFTLVVGKKTSHAERIRIVRYQSTQADPLAASRLKQLNRIVSGSAADKALAVGDVVPDFRLIDQKRRPVAFADMRGKVVAINFIYTRCALPNFCLRIANNFGVLQKRFKRMLGRDLVLLTVTFDPVHDTPEALAQYGDQFKADSVSWRFLTGPVPDVQRVCQLFGVDAFLDEGLMDHNLHTALIDRQGRLIANIEGNQFTASQLGDLTETALK